MNLLDKIMIKNGSDKGVDQNNYCRYYHPILKDIREDYKKVMEIGVWKGGSTRSWKEYFPNAQILGLDIMPECLNHVEDRISIHIGNQDDTSFLKSVAEKRIAKEDYLFDMIIDDGSHRMSSMKLSFDTLFPYVRSGGYYVVEDLTVCYPEPRYKDYKDAGDFIMIDYLKSLVDDINNSGFTNYRGKFPLAEQIDSMFFGQWICFIKKK